jgi:hypothetical protein
LRAIDVQDPTAPRVVGAVEGMSSVGVQVAGVRAYLARRPGGVNVIDVSDPASLREVGHAEVPGFDAVDIKVDGPRAFVAGPGLLVLDIADLGLPRTVGALVTSEDAVGVHYSDGYAFMVDRGYGIHVIDVSDPVSPRQVGDKELDGVLHHVSDVFVAHSHAYVTDQTGSLGANMV